MDKRTKTYRRIRSLKKYLKDNRGALWFAFFAGLLAAGILIRTLKNAQKASLELVKQTIPVVEAYERPFCNDVINCIRDVGEELGVPNQDIMQMIRIARYESNFKERAKNPKSTASGVFQIIAGTWYSNDCVGDKWIAEDNIRCAYKIYFKRGFQPWSVYNSGLAR